MKKLLSIVSFSLLILSGCAGVHGVMKNPFAMDSPLIRQYTAKAEAFEKEGDLLIALQYWEVIHSLTPEKSVSSKNIERLKNTITAQAEAHLKKGITLLKQKKMSGAEKEFLAVLRLSPDNSSALEFLTREINGDETITYKVNPGDTFESIAAEIYKNPDTAFLIAHACAKTDNGRPLPGEFLTLPYLEKRYHSQTEQNKAKDPVVPIEQKTAEDLKQAKKYFKSGDYEKVLTITEGILEDDSENRDAYNLTLDSYYQLGKKLKTENQYFSSLEMFRKLSPDYKDVKDLMADLDTAMQAQSELHYRLGLKYFINEDLPKAIQEWEKSLHFNPDNEKAEKDIKDARDLMEKLQKIE